MSRVCVKIYAALALATCCAMWACSPPPLDSAMAGTWWGSAEVAIEGMGTKDFTPGLTLRVDDMTTEIDGLCLQGVGAATASGSGTRAEWDGVLSCPPLPDPECPVTLTYAHVSVSYDPDVDSLSVDASGIAQRCSVSVPFTMSFLGVRW